jgi:MoxR-like ATPase
MDIGEEIRQMSAREYMLELKNRVSRSIIGQEHVVERLLLALLANGNVLMEGLPGLAKTRAIKTLARHIESEFRRIQFTPDLLPSDITGTEIYYSEGGSGSFRFQPGPLFGNVVLADEINRAPAKVQAALLEAMEERQITVAGQTHPLPALFMVLATQNPIEQEGTYPLPEAQMDRFLMHIMVEYPDEASEVQILRLVRAEESTSGSSSDSSRIAQDVVFEARREIQQVSIAEAIDTYIVALISATRDPGRYSDQLKTWIHVGASPRGGIALDKVSRAHAWLNGRDFVSPDDVRAVIHDCLRHRISLSYEANAEGITADHIIQEIVTQVAVA